MADLGLADAVDAPEALLQPVRVPGEVVVDHQVRALQIDALARGVRRQQHLHFRVVPERLLHRQAFLAPDAAVDDDDGLLADHRHHAVGMHAPDGAARLQIFETHGSWSHLPGTPTAHFAQSARLESLPATRCGPGPPARTRGYRSSRRATTG